MGVDNMEQINESQKTRRGSRSERRKGNGVRKIEPPKANQRGEFEGKYNNMTL